MHYLVQDVIYISLVLMGFLAIFQGAQILMRRLDGYRKKPKALETVALHDMKNQP
ncbi:MAG: hypothetical protein ABWY08_03000 [Comamonas sp.]